MNINFGCKLEDGLVTFSEVKSLWNLKGVYEPVIHCFDDFAHIAPNTTGVFHDLITPADVWAHHPSRARFIIPFIVSMLKSTTWDFEDVFRNLVPLFGKEINRFGGTFPGRKKFMPFKSSLFIVSVAILAVRICPGVFKEHLEQVEWKKNLFDSIILVCS